MVRVGGTVSVIAVDGEEIGVSLDGVYIEARREDGLLSPATVLTKIWMSSSSLKAGDGEGERLGRCIAVWS